MQFKKDILDQIAAKRVTLAFRRWRKPSVKAGDALATAAGTLAIGAVDKIAIAKIPEADLKRAGYPSRAALLKELAKHPGGDVYRIAFRLRVAGPVGAKEGSPPPPKVEPRVASKVGIRVAAKIEPRITPKIEPRVVPKVEPRVAPKVVPRAAPKVEERITRTEIRSAIAALKSLDQAGEHGAWTATTLRLIDKYPARRTSDLAVSQRRDPLAFKRDVLRLKQLGLAEPLEIGYRLSSRGRAVLAEIGTPIAGPVVSAPRFTAPILAPRRIIQARAFAPVRQD